MAGEYRGKIVIEAEGEQDVARVTNRIVGMHSAYDGLRGVMAGTRQVFTQPIEGMLKIGASAGLAWRALSSVHPVLRVVSIAFMTLPPILDRVIKHLMKGRDEVATFEADLKRLGLVSSDLDRLEQSMRRQADALKEMRSEAKETADAYDRMVQAMTSVATLRAAMDGKKLDLEESIALAQTNDPSKRAYIRADFAKRRVMAEDVAERDRIFRRSDELTREREGINRDVTERSEERKRLELNARRFALEMVKASPMDLTTEGWDMYKRMMKGDASAFRSVRDPGALLKADKNYKEGKSENWLSNLKDFKSAFNEYHETIAKLERMNAGNAQYARNQDQRRGAIDAEMKALEEAIKDLPEQLQLKIKAANTELGAELRRIEQQATTVNRGGDDDRLRRERERREAMEVRRIETLQDSKYDLARLGRGETQRVGVDELFSSYYAGGIANTDLGKQILEDRAREQVEILKVIAANTMPVEV